MAYDTNNANNTNDNNAINGARQPQRAASRHTILAIAAAIAVMCALAALLITQPWRQRDDNILNADANATAQTGETKGPNDGKGVEGDNVDGEGDDSLAFDTIDISDETDLPAIGLNTQSNGSNAAGAQAGAKPGGAGEGGGTLADAKPVACVAGINITAPEFRYFLNYYKSSQLLNSGVTAGSEDEIGFWANEVGAGGETMLDYAKRQTLAELGDLKMCVAIARGLGIALDVDDAANINTTLRIQADRFGGEAGLRDVLAEEYGVTAEEYRELLEDFTLRAKLLRSARESTPVTSEEAREYYEANADNYNTARVREIVFLTEGLEARRPRADEQTRAIAEDVLKRALAGEDMAELAASLSEDRSAQAGGGFAEYNKADAGFSATAAWAFDADPGEIGLIETAYGYCVIKLEARDAEDFASAEQAIVDSLKDQKMERLLEEWKRDPKYAPVVNDEAYKAIV